MKIYVQFLFLIFFMNCSGQEISKNIDGFADKNYLATSKSNAAYYRIHKPIDDIMTVNMNPNANLSTGQIMPDEYGSLFNMVPSGVQYHEITFYNLNNQKVMVSGALVNGKTYELYNMATWFDAKGNKTEVGFFKDNTRGNIYEKFDKNGQIIESGYYVNGKVFNDYHVDKRLVGKWESKVMQSDLLGGEYPEKLINRLSKDGVMEIWVEPYVQNEFTEGFEPDIVRFHSSFKKTGTNTGVLSTIDYFTGEVNYENIEIVDSNTFISTITEHDNPEFIGKTYTFHRVH